MNVDNLHSKKNDFFLSTAINLPLGIDSYPNKQTSEFFSKNKCFSGKMWKTIYFTISIRLVELFSNFFLCVKGQGAASVSTYNCYK